MILQSLRCANRDFDKLYNEIEYTPIVVYTLVAILVMVFLAVISLFVVNLGTYVYEIMVIIIVLAFTVLCIFSFTFYFDIKRYKMSSTAEILEKKVMKFKKEWRILAVIWITVVTCYIIPALNIEVYSEFFFNNEIQTFIWFTIPLLLVCLSIIFFYYLGFQSTELTRNLINKKLAEKSLLPEIDAYVRGLDGKLEIIHGFIVNLGRYVKLETEKTCEILKYADIQRISSPKEISDLKCK